MSPSRLAALAIVPLLAGAPLVLAADRGRNDARARGLDAPGRGAYVRYSLRF